ncbi:MAG: F0F1 ATP synthase subunit B [Sodalis sp. (in: enterobacteria)]
MNINATIFGQAIAFILFVLFCMKYVWPPLIAAIEKRQKEIFDGLVFAERAKKDLDIAQAKIIDRLKLANVEAQVIITQANKHKAQVVNEAKIAAESERKKILMQAKIEIDTERKRIREELRKQLAVLILLGAEKIIEHSVDITANSKIVDKTIAEL